MESFGRVIAVVVGIIGVVFLLLLSGTASVRWQRYETVRSLSDKFAQDILFEKKISYLEWDVFRQEIGNLGDYRAELTVYERCRFEDENGSFWLYRTEEVDGDKTLSEGSYVRVSVSLANKAGSSDVFQPGDYGVIVAGGCVQ